MMHLSLKRVSSSPLRALALPLAVVLLSSGAIRPVAAEPIVLDRIVAVVEDQVVLLSELESRQQVVLQNMRAGGAEPPPLPQLRARILEQLIIESLQLYEANRYGLEIADDELNATMKRIAESNGMTMVQFQRALAADGFSYEETREQTRRDVLIARYQYAKLGARLEVSESDIDVFLQEEEARTDLVPEYHLRHIFLPIDTTDAASAGKQRQLAEDISSRVASGEEFGTLAVTYSQGQEALSGGDLGWRKSVSLPSEFAEAIGKVKLGELAPIIELANGVHLLQVIDKRGKTVNFEMQYHVDHIQFSTNPLRDFAATQQLAVETRERLASGADFGDLALELSDDVRSKLRRGKLGWITPEQLPSDVAGVLVNLGTGQLSEPIRSQYGWHLVRVNERRRADLSGGTLRDYAYRVLRDRKFQELLPSMLAELRQSSYVEIRG